jgi:hypothetical protein
MPNKLRAGGVRMICAIDFVVVDADALRGRRAGYSGFVSFSSIPTEVGAGCRALFSEMNLREREN